MNLLKQLKLSLWVIAVVFILLGLALIIWPLGAQMFICWVLAIAAVAFGVFKIINYFTSKKLGAEFQFGLVVGTLFVVLGILMMIWSKQLVTVFGVVIGIAIIVNSVIRLQLAIEFKRNMDKKWIVMLLAAAVMLIFGIILLFSPLKTAQAAAVFAGIIILIDGVFTLGEIIYTQIKLK